MSSKSGVAWSQESLGPHSRNIFQMLAGGAAAQSEIAASWDRCIRLHKLDPECRQNLTVVTQPELLQAAETMEPYLRSAEREIDNLTLQLSRLGFFLSIATADGVVVTHRGKMPNLSTQRSRLQNGMCWGEETQGTNAIGTSLYAGRPTIIYQDEHFFEANVGMSCIAAPLFAPTGAVIGVLNTATLDLSVERCLTTILQSLLVAAAQKMEALWFRETFPDALIITTSEAARAAGSIPLLAVDSNLNVLGATCSARAHFRITNTVLDEGLHIDQVKTDLRIEKPSLGDAERAALKRALTLAGQNVSLAASGLGISRATMIRKMAACGLKRCPTDSRSSPQPLKCVSRKNGAKLWRRDKLYELRPAASG